MNGSRVPLPSDASRPFQVYVNGILQSEGSDYEVTGSELVFATDLIPPKRDTAKTYARLMFWGRYKTEHHVDLAYEVNGVKRVASKLPVRNPA
jgi:hypothetical protein